MARASRHIQTEPHRNKPHRHFVRKTRFDPRLLCWIPTEPINYRSPCASPSNYRAYTFPIRAWECKAPSTRGIRHNPETAIKQAGDPTLRHARFVTLAGMYYHSRRIYCGAVRSSLPFSLSSLTYLTHLNTSLSLVSTRLILVQTQTSTFHQNEVHRPCHPLPLCARQRQQVPRS
jgi:hypothetical protein